MGNLSLVKVKTSFCRFIDMSNELVSLKLNKPSLKKQFISSCFGTRTYFKKRVREGRGCERRREGGAEGNHRRRELGKKRIGGLKELGQKDSRIYRNTLYLVFDCFCLFKPLPPSSTFTSRP